MKVIALLCVIAVFFYLLYKTIGWKIEADAYRKDQKKWDKVSEVLDREVKAPVNTPERKDLALQIIQILEQ